MTEASTLVRQYLAAAEVAQLATATHDKPWVSTVYVVADDEQRVYWLSYPERRHSRELVDNPRAALAIAIKVDQPVIGLQLEGRVDVVHDADIVKRVIDRYIAVHKLGTDFYDSFAKGTNRHYLYALTPERINLFDEVHFPGGVPRVVQLLD